MQQNKFFQPLFALICLTLIANSATAQKKIVNDPNYYETFPDKITGRLYLAQKYIHLNFPATNSNTEDLEYKANPKMNLGLGVSIGNFSINAFYGFAFLNKKDEAKGETKGLNLQLHLYPHKWAIDLYAEFPKGFHLEPKGFAANSSSSYYYRPDIKESFVGISAYRVPNKEKFSYRAAIVQTEWQKKSAGSLLYGGDVYFGTLKGDSALVPVKVQGGFSQAGIKKINFVSFGPGIGYAYTLVLKKHFFVTGSMVGNLNLNFSKEEASSINNKFSLSPASVFKAAIGYNSSSWNVSANWTGNGVWFKGASSRKDYFWPSGQYRVVLAKKFDHKKHHSS
jgi:Domain of unknown function (DUF4421)